MTGTLPTGYLDTLLPQPGHDAALRRALARDTKRRLSAALRGWRRHSTGGRARAAVAAARMLGAILDQRFLTHGPFRCWLAAVEDAVALASLARSRRASLSALVARVADLGLLAELAPAGAIPPLFARRALESARRQLDVLVQELPLVLLGAGQRKTRTLRVRVSLREDADLGRPCGELDVPGVGRALVPRRPESAILTTRDGMIAVSGVRLALRGLTGRTAADPDAPDVGALVHIRHGKARVLARDPRFEAGVRRALAFLRRAWPAAAAMIEGRTHRVVPVTDRGVVSYSSGRRPGITYVHVRSSPAVRLAEDLLHEATHQRLHDIEALHPLVADTTRGGEPPRFYSPWRRTWRPLRGLLHAACTFTVGALLFERLLSVSDRGAPRGGPGPFLPAARRLWLGRRLLEETESVRLALRFLRGAVREDLLAPAGRRLFDAVAREHRGLRAAARHRASWLGTSAAGREQLERARLHAARLTRF